MHVVGGSAACRRASSEELPPLVLPGGVHGAVLWDKLLHSLKDANAFWQEKGFGVSAGYSRMRGTRLAGVDGFVGTA